MSETKTCSKCGELKAVELFHQKQSKCKVCTNIVMKIWQKNNPEKVLAWSSQWGKNNPEKAKESAKKWKLKNPEKVATSIKKWQLANPEKCNKWRKENRDLMNRRFMIKAKSNRADLVDGYLRELLSISLQIPTAIISNELIEAKRTHLQILRKIKELANER